METRFVPDAAGTWLVYDLGALVVALPTEFRAAVDAVAAAQPVAVPGVLAALTASGIAESAPGAVLEVESGALHVALRGPATVSVGAQTLTGLGSDEWVHHVVPGADVIRLTVPGGEWTLTSAPVAARAVPAPRAAVPPLAPLFHDGQDTAVPDLEASGPPTRLDRPGAVDAADGTVLLDEVARVRTRRATGRSTPSASPASRPASRLSLVLPDGSSEPLDPAVIVGRAPSAAGGTASRLVRIEGDGDISRNHARVAVEGGTVVVTDLGSRNGTIVRVPGRAAQKLRAGEPTPVLVGTVIDFGGGIELSVRED